MHKFGKKKKKKKWKVPSGDEHKSGKAACVWRRITALCSPVGAFITGISKMAALLEIIV